MTALFSTPFATLLAIEIPWTPNITEIGPFLLTWHGLFTALGILGGVRIAMWGARRNGVDLDDAYTIALVAVPSGIVGARALFVAEHWDYYGQNIGDIFAITEGGISIWGAVLGGIIGGALFTLWRRWPLWRIADLGGMGLITGMGIGRLGDLVNGEHLAKATDLPWGVIYTHPNSPAFAHSIAVGAHHPATTYEMLGDFAILGLLIWLFLGPFKYRHGLTFWTFLASYAVMRYLVSFLRIDSSDTFLPGATTPQLVSIVVVLVAIPFILTLWRRGEEHEPPPPPRPPAATATRT